MFKKTQTWLAIIGLVAAAAAAWWFQNRPAGGGGDGPVALAAGGAGSASRGDGAALRQDGVPAGSGAPRAAGPGGPPGPAGPVPVEVGRAERARIADDAQAVGTLRARQGVVLRPEVSGRILALNFSDGQRVRRGQVLVQLDAQLQQAQLRQAQAQASIASTQLQRNRDLAAQSFVSQNAVDQSAANLEVAQAQVALAQAQLARMSIVAPFDGVVGIRSVNVGDYVKDGAELVSIEDTSQIWVDYRLPERYFAKVKNGQPVEVTLDAAPGRAFTGRVDALDALLAADGRSLLVRAQIDNKDGALRSGMFARTRTVFAVRDDAVVVPEEALVPQGGRQFIMKVIDGPGGRKMSERIEAKVGLRLPGKVEILEGLKPGDMVVTAGQARLLRGESQPVRIIDLAKAGAPGGGGRPNGASAPGGSASGAMPGGGRPAAAG